MANLRVTKSTFLPCKSTKIKYITDVIAERTISNIFVGIDAAHEMHYCTLVYKQFRNYSAVHSSEIGEKTDLALVRSGANCPVLTDMLILKSMTSDRGCSGSAIFVQRPNNVLVFVGFHHGANLSYTFACDAVACLETIRVKHGRDLQVEFRPPGALFAHSNRQNQEPEVDVAFTLFSKLKISAD